MKQNPTYAVRSFTIPAGGAESTMRAASFVTCLAASGAFKLSFDNAPEVDFEAGLTYRTVEGFQRVEIRNPSGAPITVTLGFGRGDIKDARLTLTGTIGTKGRIPDAPLVTKAAVSALNAANTILAPQNVNRKELILANEGAGAVYINGTVAVLAGQGIPLAAGQTLILENTNAIYARNDTGAAVAIAVAENEFTP